MPSWRPGDEIRYMHDEMGLSWEDAWSIGIVAHLFDRFATAWLLCVPEERPKLVNMFANLPKKERRRVEEAGPMF